jgi:hypothetical protein
VVEVVVGELPVDDVARDGVMVVVVVDEPVADEPAVGGGFTPTDEPSLLEEAVSVEELAVVDEVDADERVLEGGGDDEPAPAGAVRPGSGEPATSPAPCAVADVARGTPGNGGFGWWGRTPSSWRASRAMVAKVGADAAAP